MARYRYYANRDNLEGGKREFSTLQSMLSYLNIIQHGEIFIEDMPGKIVFNTKLGIASHQDQCNSVQSFFYFGGHSSIALAITLLAKLALIEHLEKMNIPEIHPIVTSRRFDFDQTEDIYSSVTKALEQTKELMVKIESALKTGDSEQAQAVFDILSNHNNVTSLNGALEVIDMINKCMQRYVP